MDNKLNVLFHKKGGIFGNPLTAQLISSDTAGAGCNILVEGA